MEEDAIRLRDWILDNAGLEAQSMPIAIRVLWLMDRERREVYEREHTPNTLEEDIGEEEEVQSQFLDLQRRLQTAEAVNQRVSQELTSVLESIKHIIAEKRSATRNQTKETKKDVNITENRKYHVLNAYYYLPHLAQSENSLRPNVAIGQGRTNVSLVLGIPTVKREKQNYLMDTLNSLLYELSQEERSDCIIIVFIAETDVQYVNSLAADIKKSFPSEVQSGLLEVVSPSPGFYPNFTDLKETFGDTRERVKWRTKQNLDYSFLMLYAQDKGRFYVQDSTSGSPGKDEPIGKARPSGTEKARLYSGPYWLCAKQTPEAGL
ncbi:UNVERIFIED_CONTAM: hypothetical protein FKN15_027883 [Acipenser sinensis]